MNFLKRVYDKLHPADPQKHLSTPASQAEATEALAKADTDLNAVIRREATVSALTSQLRDQLERNHFGELVELSMRPTS